MPSFEIVGADTLAPQRLHAAFTAAFADYLIGPFNAPLAQWPAFMGRHGVDGTLSRVALAGGEPIAFCLVAPRPERNSWRLAVMGALPAARGTGAAPALLDDFLARARAAGAASVELECFAQNTRALRLYEGRGFATIDALHGWQRETDAAATAEAAPAAVALEDAFAWLEACPALGCELPLQVTPRSLRALAVQLQAWRRADAQLVFSEGADGRITIHSLVDRDAAQTDAERLVAALLGRHAGRTVYVPQLQRQCLGGDALGRLGFTRLPLHQLWLHRPAG